MLETLIMKAREYLPEERLGVVEEAFHYAAEAHSGQLRKSGEPFLEHPFQTTMVLADLRLDADALAAGLLHDVVEDSPDVVIGDIQSRFGDDVARLVDGVTKFTEAELVAAGTASLAAGGARAGGDDPQDADGNGRRHQGRAHQASGQASQHAHDPAPV